MAYQQGDRHVSDLLRSPHRQRAGADYVHCPTYVRARVLGRHMAEPQSVSDLSEVGLPILNPLYYHRAGVGRDVTLNIDTLSFFGFFRLGLQRHDGAVQHIQRDFLLSHFAKSVVGAAGILAGVLHTNSVDDVVVGAG